MTHSLPLRSLPRTFARFFADVRNSAALSAATLAIALFAGLAHADEYADVNQLLRQGKSSEALAKAELYIAGKPRDPQMRFLRGVILNEQGKQGDAIAAFSSLTQEFPELPEPYNNLAALYASQSQFEQARAALETAIKLNPNYATAYENLGDIYIRLAGQVYGRSQQLEPANTTIAPKLVLVRQLFSASATSTVGAAPATAAASSVARKAVRTK
jgi:Flp pilus assembly protein TadD